MANFSFCSSRHQSSDNVTKWTQEAAVGSVVSKRCLLCGLIFGTERCLSQHVIRASKSDCRGHRCKICRHEVSDKAKMIHHLKTDTQEKPFSCPHCPYRTTLKVHLQSHVGVIHTGERYFSFLRSSAAALSTFWGSSLQTMTKFNY